MVMDFEKVDFPWQKAIRTHSRYLDFLCVLQGTNDIMIQTNPGTAVIVKRRLYEPVDFIDAMTGAVLTNMRRVERRGDNLIGTHDALDVSIQWMLVAGTA